jgi:hypothetical protein
MVKFHVDASDLLLAAGKVGQFGGYLSVQFPAGCKPLIMFGHFQKIFDV